LWIIYGTVSISLVIRDEYDRLQLQEGIFLPSELAERLLHQVQARDFPISELGKTAAVNRGIFIIFPLLRNFDILVRIWIRISD
jgi:hypothetical protein